MPEAIVAPPIAVDWLAYVPLSWHRVRKVARDEHGRPVRDQHGRVIPSDELTKLPRGRPIGWLDRDTDGLVWALA